MCVWTAAARGRGAQRQQQHTWSGCQSSKRGAAEQQRYSLVASNVTAVGYTAEATASASHTHAQVQPASYQNTQSDKQTAMPAAGTNWILVLIPCLFESTHACSQCVAATNNHAAARHNRPCNFSPRLQISFSAQKSTPPQVPQSKARVDKSRHSQETSAQPGSCRSCQHRSFSSSNRRGISSMLHVRSKQLNPKLLLTRLKP